MKTAKMLLPLLMLACSAHALPVEVDVASTVDRVDGNVLPITPVDEESELSDVASAEDDVYRGVPPLLQEEEEEGDSQLVRERRSPGGWQQGRGGSGAPQRQPQEPRGSVSGSVHRERGVGTVVQAEGRGNVWTSRNGNARLDAHGQWSRVVRGPARGRPNYNVGVTYRHRF